MRGIRSYASVRLDRLLLSCGVASVVLVAMAYDHRSETAPSANPDFSFSFDPPYSDYWNGTTDSWAACSGSWPGAGEEVTSVDVSTGSFEGWTLAEANWVPDCSSNTAQSQVSIGFHSTSGWEMTGPTGYYTLQALWALQLNALVVGTGCTGTAEAQISFNIGMWDASTSSNVLSWASGTVYTLAADSEAGDGVCQWGTISSIGEGAAQFMTINEQNGVVSETENSSEVYMIQGDTYIPRSDVVVTSFVDCGNDACAQSIDSGTFAVINEGFETNTQEQSTPFVATLDYLTIE